MRYRRERRTIVDSSVGNQLRYLRWKGMIAVGREAGAGRRDEEPRWGVRGEGGGWELPPNENRVAKEDERGRRFWAKDVGAAGEGAGEGEDETELLADNSVYVSLCECVEWVRSDGHFLTGKAVEAFRPTLTRMLQDVQVNLRPIFLCFRFCSFPHFFSTGSFHVFAGFFFSLVLCAHFFGNRSVWHTWLKTTSGMRSLAIISKQMIWTTLKNYQARSGLILFCLFLLF